MDPNTQELVMGAAGASGGPKVYVEDVFSTYLYTGNGNTGGDQIINNGIDLAGKGGLVWVKNRTAFPVAGGYNSHWLVDSTRGQNAIRSNLSDAQIAFNLITNFSSTGFTVRDELNWGIHPTYGGPVNFTSWTFRKAAKFFDVVTYTGNGSNRTIAHSLGSVPGCIIVKRIDSPDSWRVYHRSLAPSEYLTLSANEQKFTDNTLWNNTAPTNTVFSVGTAVEANANGGTYVAYLFAHDAGGFGDSGNDSIIKCGSFTGGSFVDLGWEPQWVLMKTTTVGDDWRLFDAMRGTPVNGNDANLSPNVSNSEAATTNFIEPASTGFTPTSAFWSTFPGIYIAIRRGPMKTPTDATKIFSALARTGTGTATSIDVGFAPDFATSASRNSGEYMPVVDKLRGPTKPLTWQQSMKSGELIGYEPDWFLSFTNTGVTVGPDNTGGVSVNSVNRPLIQYYFRRAPGFFDVVAYTGTGFVNLDVSHNLGVPPEIIITKRRDTASTTGWFTSSKYYYNTDLWDRNGRLNDGTIGFSGGQVYGPDANITSTQFRIATNTSDLNASGGKYIAYLFASCPGVSKCGGYIGSGTTKQIDCGFTNGARFVLIKRADAAGDWYVWDTARGILSANDPYLLLNSTAAEVTNTDYIDPLSSGFEISSTAPAAINANGGSYIFLAIA